MMAAMSHEETVLSILRVWAATAWADGAIADEEDRALRRLIKYSDLPAEHQARARAWLDEPVALETDKLERLSDERKLFIYRVAVEMARVDLELAGPERALLNRLREALALAQREAGEIEIEVREQQGE